MLENLPANTLPRLLRRTTLSALAVGVVAFVVSLLVAPPLAALGIVLGMGGAIFNLRVLDRQSARAELSEGSTKAVRRQLGSRTTLRLAVATVVVVVLLFLNAPLGVGTVAGLVLYQIVFVVNAARVVAQSGGLK